MFVNLAENKEQFTGYKGAPIWQAIYQENCSISPKKRDALDKIKGTEFSKQSDTCN